MKPPKQRDLWMLFCFALAVRLVLAALISRPGYMERLPQLIEKIPGLLMLLCAELGRRFRG